MDHVLVVVGGVIPPQDYQELYDIGVGRGGDGVNWWGGGGRRALSLS
jgi:hypothetical protein